MVHALHEVHQVAKPEALVIDLRPAMVHRRVAIRQAGRLVEVGVMREGFDIDRAANAAITQAIRSGHFRQLASRRIPFSRVLSTVEEFKDWLDDFLEEDSLPGHEVLLARVRRAFEERSGRRSIVVQGPLQMRILRARRIPHSRNHPS